MLKALGKIIRDVRGATAVEYGLIVALIVIVMLVALLGVADVTIDMWDNVADDVENA